MALLPFLNRQTFNFVFSATITVLLFNIFVNIPFFDKLVQWPNNLFLFALIMILLYNKTKIVSYVVGKK